MPRQLDNKGLLRQNAIHDCGNCLNNSKVRANVDFNIIRHGRYHHQPLMVRRTARGIKTKNARDNLSF